MRQQPIPNHSFSEAEAIRIVRGLGSGVPPQSPRESSHARAVLARAVENEVIPRLLKARQDAAGQHHPRPAPPTPSPQAPHHEDFGPDAAPQPDHVAALVRLLLTGTASQASSYVEALLQRETDADVLLLDLLTRAARCLGEMWDEDLCDFTQVSIGIMRLNNAVRLICATFESDTAQPPQNAARRVLLVQAPGEQHGLGLAMVAYYFRRGGWDVRTEPVVALDDLLRLVRENWFGVLGISVSYSDPMDALAAGIAAIRRESRNPRIGVLVGGPAFIADPEAAVAVGADATAADGRLAVQQADILLSRLARDR